MGKSHGKFRPKRLKDLVLQFVFSGKNQDYLIRPRRTQVYLGGWFQKPNHGSRGPTEAKCFISSHPPSGYGRGRFRLGSPTRNIIILLVTVFFARQGDDPNSICVFNDLESDSFFSNLDRFQAALCGRYVVRFVLEHVCWGS